MAIAGPLLVDNNDAIVADVDPAVAASAGLRLIGWNALAIVTGSFRIKNSATGAGGTRLASGGAVAGESIGEWYGPKGLPAPDGLSIDWILGTWDIDLYYLDEEA